MIEKHKYNTIETNRLILRWLDEKYVTPVLNFLNDGRDIFSKYEAKKVPLFYTKPFQEHILKSEYEAALRHTYMRYYIFSKDEPDKVIGTVSFGNLLPDPYLCANIGYKMSPSVHGLGYGTEAVIAACDVAFKYLNLHRLNAFVLPDNYASIRLLEKCGFLYEGRCNKNLHVNGEWLDHLLYGKIV